MHPDRNIRAYHLPLHRYAGPGTDIHHNILNKVLPTTDLDLVSMVHDIEYLMHSQDISDSNMVKNISLKYPTIPLEYVVYIAFKVKDAFGYHVPRDFQQGFELSKHAVDLVPETANLFLINPNNQTPNNFLYKN